MQKNSNADFFNRLFEPIAEGIVNSCFQSFGDKFEDIEYQIKFLEYCKKRLDPKIEGTINEWIMNAALDCDQHLTDYSIVETEIAHRGRILNYMRKERLASLDLEQFRIDAKLFWQRYQEDHEKLIIYSQKRFPENNEFRWIYLKLWVGYLQSWSLENRTILREAADLKAYVGEIEQEYQFWRVVWCGKLLELGFDAKKLENVENISFKKATELIASKYIFNGKFLTGKKIAKAFYKDQKMKRDSEQASELKKE